MSCEYCLEIGGRHDVRCPNFSEKRANHYCSICGEGILNGEEYIRNDNNLYVHYECSNVRDVVDFLGYEVKVMESEDGYDEYE